MALPDLTGQNIQNTYQRVLTVGADGNMFDGTGSLFIPLSASVEITEEVSSSHSDTADTATSLSGIPSIHVTNITASGNISSSGTGPNYFGGSIITSGIFSSSYALTGVHNVFGGIVDIHNNLDLIGDKTTRFRGGVKDLIEAGVTSSVITNFGHQMSIILDATGNRTDEKFEILKDSAVRGLATPIFAIGAAGSVTASGNISSSGAVKGANLQAATSLQVNSRRIDYDNTNLRIRDTGLNVVGHITASGNISSSGNVQVSDSGYFIGTQVPPALSIEASRLRISSSNDIFYDSADDHIFLSEGTEIVHIRGDEAILEVEGDIDLDGNLDAAGNITASGDISSSGTILAQHLLVREGVNGGIIFDNDGGRGAHTSITSPAAGGINIYANSDNPGASTHLFVTQSGGTGTAFGKVGINTLTPTKALQVAGDISASGELHGTDLLISSKNYVNYHAGNNIFRVSADGTPVEFFTSTTATNITASGNISALGAGISITDAGRFYLDGGTDTYLSALGNNNQIHVYGNNTQIAKFASNLNEHFYVTGHISASGRVIGNTGSFDVLTGTGASTGLEVTGFVSASNQILSTTGSFEVNTNAITTLPFAYNLVGNHDSELYVGIHAFIAATTPQYYNKYIPPYDGKIKRISIGWQTPGNDPGDTTVRVRKDVGTAFDVSSSSTIFEQVTIAGCDASETYNFNFSSSFSNGDLMAFSVQQTGTDNNQIVGTVVVELNTSSPGN